MNNGVIRESNISTTSVHLLMTKFDEAYVLEPIHCSFFNLYVIWCIGLQTLPIQKYIEDCHLLDRRWDKLLLDNLMKWKPLKKGENMKPCFQGLFYKSSFLQSGPYDEVFH